MWVSFAALLPVMVFPIYFISIQPSQRIPGPLTVFHMNWGIILVPSIRTGVDGLCPMAVPDALIPVMQVRVRAVPIPGSELVR